MTTAAMVTSLWTYSRFIPLPPQAKLAVNALMGVTIVQVINLLVIQQLCSIGYPGDKYVDLYGSYSGCSCASEWQFEFAKLRDLVGWDFEKS